MFSFRRARENIGRWRTIGALINPFAYSRERRCSAGSVRVPSGVRVPVRARMQFSYCIGCIVGRMIARMSFISDCTRINHCVNLRRRIFQKFPGWACPQTPLALESSLETGPPPSGQLNAGVRQEEGLARRPCRARTQECGHLQFEAMHVHIPTVNSGLAVNMATYCKACGHYICCRMNYLSHYYLVLYQNLVLI